jgi:hypothetical protein
LSFWIRISSFGDKISGRTPAIYVLTFELKEIPIKRASSARYGRQTEHEYPEYQNLESGAPKLDLERLAQIA